MFTGAARDASTLEKQYFEHTTGYIKSIQLGTLRAYNWVHYATTGNSYVLFSHERRIVNAVQLCWARLLKMPRDTRSLCQRQLRGCS